MNGRMLLAGLLVAAIYFVLGGVFYAWLMADFFETQMPVMETNMALVALMCLSYGLLMAFTYPYGYKGGSLTGEGMRFGILFALIVNLPSSLGWLAQGMGTWPGMIVSLIYEVIVGAVLGIVVARMYGSTVRAAVPRPV